MDNILWLPSWYPNRKDIYHGDFIERHAKAISAYTKLTIMVVVKDESLPVNKTEIDKSVSGNLTVYRVYYGRSRYSGWVEQLISLLRYFRLQKKIFKQVIETEGQPKIVHVHVAMKAGLLALWLKKQYNIPFVVTEHWTGYYPQSTPNIYNSNWLFRLLDRRVLEHAEYLLPVSKDLGTMINERFAKTNCRVIPNTVDTSLFYYQPVTTKRFRFIHPSYMNFQKNPEGILQACKMVKDQGYDFELLMLGNKPTALTEMAATFGLQNEVTFRDAVPYEAVAKEMQQSNALLLFSRFENLPCVIAEALCCGLPVISSRVGGIPEVINENNGRLIESDNIAALSVAMIKLMHSYETYNRQQISEDAVATFQYAQVGNAIMDVYMNVLSS
ncbi:MAG: glycosyltransferase [Ferruginibacter sp.]